MGFFKDMKNELAGQFIEILQWLDDSPDAMVYRFPVQSQEIKMGAQLTVRENQMALFVNEGKAADLFAPGRYTLETKNLPVLSDLRGWKYGFESPFKAEVYFFNTRLFTDLKWGTANPVLLRDADLGMVRLRAYGTYAMRIADPKAFFGTIVGTRGLTTRAEIEGQLRSILVSRFSDAVAESKIPALELSSRYDQLSEEARGRIQPEFAGFGLELARFYVENISLPEEVEAAVDQRSKLGVLGDRLGQYTQMQAAEAIPVAAANPGGLAGAGAGLGVGVAVGGSMAQALNPALSPPPPPAWTVLVNGQPSGPYEEATLKSLVAGGRVDRDAQAWRPGAPGWAPLRSFPEFAGLEGPPPPPAPPAERK